MLGDELRLQYEKVQRRCPAGPQRPGRDPHPGDGYRHRDLSAVMLASLPRTVASYLQRVGRAGRLTGNALNIAFVTGRGDQLPRLGDPLSAINGAVRPPATYLDAEEILRRQFVASLADRLARDPQAPHPKHAIEAIGSTDPDSFLHTILNDSETNTTTRLETFLAGFPSLGEGARDALTAWVSPVEGAPGTSGLARRIFTEAKRWAHTVQTLECRRQAIQAAIPAMQQVAESPAATDDDKRALRSAKASLKLAHKQLSDLRGDYWIGVLEEHGLLPNYTLLDDSVTLDVTLSWVDPDTGEYETEPFSYHRGGTQALRDFAPGASFYANGHRLEIDAIDLGHEARPSASGSSAAPAATPPLAANRWRNAHAAGQRRSPTPSSALTSWSLNGSTPPCVATTPRSPTTVMIASVRSTACSPPRMWTPRM